MQKYFRALIGKTMTGVSNFSTEIYLSYYFSFNRQSIILFAISNFSAMILGMLLRVPIGNMLDSRNRKHVLLMNQIFTSLFLFVEFYCAMIPIMLLLFITSIMLSVSSDIGWSAINTIMRSYSDGINTGMMNGMSEVFGQLPSLLSGIFFFSISGFINLHSSLNISAILDLLSLIFLLFIPYEHNKSKTGKGKVVKVRKQSPIEAFREKRKWKKHFERSFLTMGLMLNAPFILIITGNFVLPVIEIYYLHRGADFIAIMEAVYAASAALSGIIFPNIMKKIGLRNSIFFSYSIFVFSFIIMSVYLTPLTLILSSIPRGIGNGGTRIGRNTMIMHRIENAYIGRFNGLLSFYVDALKILLVFLTAFSFLFISLYLVIEMETIFIFAMLTLIIGMERKFRIIQH